MALRLILLVRVLPRVWVARPLLDVLEECKIVSWPELVMLRRIGFAGRG